MKIICLFCLLFIIQSCSQQDSESRKNTHENSAVSMTEGIETTPVIIMSPTGTNPPKPNE